MLNVTLLLILKNIHQYKLITEWTNNLPSAKRQLYVLSGLKEVWPATSTEYRRTRKTAEISEYRFAPGTC